MNNVDPFYSECALPKSIDSLRREIDMVQEQQHPQQGDNQVPSKLPAPLPTPPLLVSPPTEVDVATLTTAPPHLHTEQLLLLTQQSQQAQLQAPPSVMAQQQQSHPSLTHTAAAVTTTAWQTYAAATCNSLPADMLVVPGAAPTIDSYVPQLRPTFVNAKQFRRILKRREARAKMEEYFRQRRLRDAETIAVTAAAAAAAAAATAAEISDTNAAIASAAAAANQLPATTLASTSSAAAARKPYMHESRHRHAMKRPRGPGGRFLTKAELVEYYKLHPEHDPTNNPPLPGMSDDTGSALSLEETKPGSKKRRTSDESTFAMSE